MKHQDVYDMMLDSDYLTREERALFTSDESFADSKVIEFCSANIPILESEIQITEAALEIRRERLTKMLFAVAQTNPESVDLNQLTFLTDEGFRLAINQSDRNDFTAFLVLLLTAGYQDESTVTIYDYLGSAHEVTYGRFKQMMVQYGMYVYQKKNEGIL